METTSTLRHDDLDWLLSLSASEVGEWLDSLPSDLHDAAAAQLAERLELLREAETSLLAFTKLAWPYMVDKPLVTGIHLQPICEHLEAVSGDRQTLTGEEIRELLINVPPGLTKTLATCVFWPCWKWGPRRHISTRWLFASFSEVLMVRASMQRRSLLESPLFKLHWPVSFRWHEKMKTRFENDQGGWMMATTVGGQGLGQHPDFFVIDDPHKAVDIESLKARESVRAWFRNTAGTRGRMRQCRFVTIMQRLHHDDFSRTMIERGAVHICLPMEFKSAWKVAPTPLGFEDPRTEEGQLLIPEVISREQYARDTRNMPPHEIDTIYNQHPPEQDVGSEWPAEWFKWERIGFDDWPTESEIQLTVMALDPSLGHNERSDYQALIVARMDHTGVIYVDARMERVDIDKLADLMIDTYIDVQPDRFVYESNGFQEALEPLVALKSRERGCAIPMLGRDSRGNKRARISGELTFYLKNNLIRLLRGSQGAEMLRRQLQLFPDPSAHDDGPDALGMAVWGLRLLWRGNLEDDLIEQPA